MNPKTVKATGWAFSWSRADDLGRSVSSVMFYWNMDQAVASRRVMKDDGFSCGRLTPVKIKVNAPKEKR